MTFGVELSGFGKLSHVPEPTSLHLAPRFARPSPCLPIPHPRSSWGLSRPAVKKSSRVTKYTSLPMRVMMQAEEQLDSQTGRANVSFLDFLWDFVKRVAWLNQSRDSPNRDATQASYLVPPSRHHVWSFPLSRRMYLYVGMQVKNTATTAHLNFSSQKFQASICCPRRSLSWEQPIVVGTLPPCGTWCVCRRVLLSRTRTRLFRSSNSIGHEQCSAMYLGCDGFCPSCLADL